MKTLILVLASAAISLADDIKLPDGTLFHNAKITNSDAASVTITHDAGIARVMIPDLPPELRAKYKYDQKGAQGLLDAEHEFAVVRYNEQQRQASSESPKSAQDAALSIVSALTTLQERGVIRIEKGQADARIWIDPATWQAIDAKEKEDFATAAALYCHPDYPSAWILDMQSGKNLASYGPIQGFKIY